MIGNHFGNDYLLSFPNEPKLWQRQTNDQNGCHIRHNNDFHNVRCIWVRSWSPETTITANPRAPKNSDDRSANETDSASLNRPGSFRDRWASKRQRNRVRRSTAVVERWYFCSVSVPRHSTVTVQSTHQHSYPACVQGETRRAQQFPQL